jgi:hypothetical protein
MKTCSPGGSATTIVQIPRDFSRTSGWDEGDHWLKLPASATLLASERITTNRTPAGVTTGAAGAILAAHETLATARRAAAINPTDSGTRMAVRD